MKNPKVYAHASYVGTTGYNNHTRDFFRHLSKHIDLKVRNFTIGGQWKGLSDEPHNEEPYLNDLDKKLLCEQTLQEDNNVLYNHSIYSHHPNNFDHNVNLVLSETNHYYFYESYEGPKIAYNVWETTLQPESFFQRLLKYDQIWVPSKWQAKCTIAQGADPNKVKIVPEGVDTKTFYPELFSPTLDYVDDRFKFILFGRWDYRKSTKEIIQTFLKTFSPEEPIDLILSIDNMWGEKMDGFKTTEERLAYYGLVDDRIKIKHFPSREDYITYIKNGHVFLSCARSEGWNLPLIEAMACGTPSIYSAGSGQMEFAEGKGLPVKIVGEKLANSNNYGRYTMSDLPGNYPEPDFEDLSLVMRDAFKNYSNHKKRALEESKSIHKNFNWDHIANIGNNTLRNFLENHVSVISQPNDVIITYTDGPKVEINGDNVEDYFIEFINGDTNEVVHSANMTNNMWTSCSRKYYIPWVIKINGKIVDKLDLTNEHVVIGLESSSIGDTIAWTPYVVEFAKKHNCKISLSTFYNSWFKNLPAYKDIEFIEPGTQLPCKTIYKIGWFRDEKQFFNNKDGHPNQVNLNPLQQTATDILGLEFKELNYGLDFPKKDRLIKGKYIVIGPESTAGCKEWPRGNWEILIKLLNQMGYQVVVLSKNELSYPQAIRYWNQSFDVIANILHHANLFIGLSSGLAWFNWALGKKTLMINNFTSKEHEFQTKVSRVRNESVCNSCWVNPNFSFDAGDWNWCPIWKGTDKQHICQKSITPIQVLNQIKQQINLK